MKTIGNVSRIFESAVGVWIEDDFFTALNISTKRKAASDHVGDSFTQQCSGKLVGQTCIIVPSTVACNITIRGGQASFQTDSWKYDHALEHMYVTQSFTQTHLFPSMPLSITPLLFWVVKFANKMLCSVQKI